MFGIGQDDGIDFKIGIAVGVIGDDLFIERMREQGDYDQGENELLEIDLKTLLSVVTNWYNVDVKTLQTTDSDRRTAQIRAIVTLLARNISREISLKEIARFFCRTESSMSQAATRFETRMRASEKLREEIGHLKQKLASASESFSLQTVNCEA